MSTKINWVTIPGYENAYATNASGDFLSIGRAVLKPYKTKSGYLTVCLYSKDGKSKTTLCHRLIALVFIPNPENKPYINHKNSIRTDNRVENLEWVTPRENIMHAWKNGRCENVLKGNRARSGENSHLRKLSWDIVEKMRKKNADEQTSYKELAREFGVDYTTCRRIVTHRTWKQ